MAPILHIPLIAKLLTCKGFYFRPLLSQSFYMKGFSMKNRISTLGLLALLAVGFNASASEIKFTENGAVTDTGNTTVKAEPLMVSYEKYPKCSAASRMYQSFVELGYSIDDGPAQYQKRFIGDLHLDPIEIPAGAKSISIWFHNYTASSPTQSSNFSCEEFDNNSQPYVNYQFQIQ
jgi:hypothetical protein